MVHKFSSIKLNLTFEVLLNLILLAVIAFLIIGIFTLRVLEKGIGTMQVENGTLVLTSMESYIKSQEAKYTDDEFNRFLENYLKSTNSAFFGSEVMLFMSGEEEAFTKFGRMYIKETLLSSLNQRITTNLAFHKNDLGELLDKERELLIYCKFELKGKKIILKGMFSLDSTRSAVSSAKKWIILTSIFFAYMLVFFGLFLFSRNITNPLKRLSKSIEALTKSDLYFPVEETGPKEIQALASSFNSMLHALKEKEDKLKEYIKELEALNRALTDEQEKVIRAEQMATLGKISSGLAHEVGNPLSAVIGYCEVALSMPEYKPEIREIIENIYEQTQRINETVKGLLDYARIKPSEISDIPLLEIVNSSLSLFTVNRKFENITVEKIFDENILVKGDKNRLIQVMVNILLNAFEAIKNEGFIKVSAEKREGFVEISISDNGCGITEENLKHIFEPFFTTKERGSGTGLGLSICQSIIESLNGKIYIESREDKGTTVYLSIPAGSQ